MESMHYINIFETKGLEYLLVISFLIGFVFLVYRLSYSSRDGILATETTSATRVANPTMMCVAPFECPYKELISTRNEDAAEKQSGVA